VKNLQVQKRKKNKSAMITDRPLVIHNFTLEIKLAINGSASNVAKIYKMLLSFKQ